VEYFRYSLIYRPRIQETARSYSCLL